MFKINSIKFFCGTIVVLALLTAILLVASKMQESPVEYLQNLPVQNFVINDNVFELYVVDTPSAQARGLSFAPGLAENTGMLFVFSEAHIPQFWMKDMKFALDMIWLDASYTVVDIHQNVTPDTYPEVFSPIKPVTYIVEVVAGTTSELGIGVGDVFEVY